ncbi:MAG: Lysine-specific demethylase 4B [Geoglossum simile]|nr:MAG: Lysine-specific demethylase 4B [Geoglossum simile]
MSTLDPESNVLTFHPSLEEFRDFPKFLTEALAASRADPDSHVGVCVVKVPQGGLYSSGPAGIARSQNSRCLQYFEQTSKVLDPNTSGVFRINHVTKGPATIAQWQKLVGGVMREHGNMVGDGRMDDLLSQESLKAVYVSNTAAKSISSLFDMDPIGLSELPGNQLQHLEIPGMSSDYIYLGAPGSLFTMHLEDYNVHSFNYLRSGEPKRWVVVNPGSRTKFENVIKATFPTIPAACSQFMRHQNLYMSPDFLRRHSIAFAEVTQTPGDMLVLFPFAYHQGYNTGENLALASNYALESEELLYERGYLPCGGECCPGQVPLVLEFPLKLQKVKEPEVVVPGSKRKVCSGREIADSTVPRKRGRPKKIIISLGEDALTAPEYNELKMVKTSKMGSGGASAVPNVPMLSPPAARKRGRPPKAKVSETDSSIAPKRGRPKKVEVSQMSGGSAPTGLHAGVSPTPPKRGRPRKMKVPEVAPSTTPNSAPTASRELAVPKTINAPNTPAGSGEPSEPSAPKPLSTSSEPTETTTDSAPTARKRGRPKKARVQEINDGGVSPPSDTAPTASNDLVVPNAPTAPNEQVATSDPNEVDMPTEPGTLATTSAPIATNASTGPNNVTEPDAPATTNAPIATNASTGPNNVTEPDAPATTNASIVINAPIESNNVTEPDAPTTTNASIAINAPTESNNVTEPNAPATTNGPIATNASTELNNVTELNAPATTNGLIATNASTELNNVTEPNAPATTNGPIAISVPTESNDVIKPVVPSEPSTRKRGRPKGAKTLEAGGGAAPVTRKRGRPPKAEANPPVEGKDVPAALEYESPTELKVHI